MSATTPIRAVKAGAAVGFLAMAVVGWKLAETPRETRAAAAGQEAAAPTKRHERRVSRGGPPEHVRERLRAIRAAATPGERMRGTVELANSLPVAELAAWLDGRWFDVGEGFDATLFKKIVMRRWMEEDPEGHAAWSLKSGGGTNILATWAKDDPQRVLAFFQKYPNEQQEIQALGVMAGSHPDIALGRLRELIGKGVNTRNSGSYYIQRAFAEIGRKNPAALEAAMDSLPGIWRNTAENILVGRRLKSDFDGELRKLWERPDGFQTFLKAANDSETRAKLLDQLEILPASWKSRLASDYHSFIDSGNAEKWLNLDLESHGFTAEQIKSVKKYSLQYLAYRKPELVLQEMAELELSDAERRNLISNLFSSSESRKPGKAEALIARLGSEEDRQFARARLETRDSDPFAEPSQAKIEKPADWLETAAKLDPQDGSSYQLFSQLGRWDSQKLAELAGGFRSLPDERKTQVAKVIVGRHYLPNDTDPTLRGEAISHLVAQPPDDQGTNPRGESPLQLASTHAVFWARKDPDAASSWVQTLPAGEAKLWAQKNLAANWAQYDPDAADRWINTLPADTRGEVRKFMKNPSSN